MSNVVGNSEDWFSHVAAQIIYSDEHRLMKSVIVFLQGNNYPSQFTETKCCNFSDLNNAVYCMIVHVRSCKNHHFGNALTRRRGHH